MNQWWSDEISYMMEQGGGSCSYTTLSWYLGHGGHEGTWWTNTVAGCSGAFFSASADSFFSPVFCCSGFFSSAGLGGGPMVMTDARLPAFLACTITSTGSTVPVTVMVPFSESTSILPTPGHHQRIMGCIALPESMSPDAVALPEFMSHM